MNSPINQPNQPTTPLTNQPGYNTFDSLKFPNRAHDFQPSKVQNQISNFDDKALLQNPKYSEEFYKQLSNFFKDKNPSLSLTEYFKDNSLKKHLDQNMQKWVDKNGYKNEVINYNLETIHTAIRNYKVNTEGFAGMSQLTVQDYINWEKGGGKMLNNDIFGSSSLKIKGFYPVYSEELSDLLGNVFEYDTVPTLNVRSVSKNKPTEKTTTDNSQGGIQGFKVRDNGVNIKNLNSEFVKILNQVGKEYSQEFGEKITINSGYRPPQKQMIFYLNSVHNRPGPKGIHPDKSAHTKGGAIDTTLSSFSPKELQFLMRKLKEAGICYIVENTNNCFHIELRPSAGNSVCGKR